MFLHNDVLEYRDPPGHLVRILWIDVTHSVAYTFALRRPSATPRSTPLHVLVADVSARRARLLLADPCRAPRVDAPSGKHRMLQMKAWDAVTALHHDLPQLYLPRPRAALLSAYSRAHGISVASLMRYLRRYWERGQTIDALLPDYANSGARGKTRAASAGVKRGRPRNGATSSANAGTNTDAALRALFLAAAAHFASTHPQFSRPAAYRQMLRDHFADCPPGAIPSYGQFNYWLERDDVDRTQ
jgi:hypothetical protein